MNDTPWIDDSGLTYQIKHRDDGWYFADRDYPEEGWTGPYSTRALAEIAARTASVGGLPDVHPDLEES